MPFSPSCLQRHVSFTQIKRFIPKKWRLGESSGGESMLDSLLKSLKDYATRGLLSEAYKTYSAIQSRALASSSFDLTIEAFCSLLVSSTDRKLLPEGEQLHAHIIGLGLEQHPALVPKLITFYTTSGLLVAAHALTETSNILHPLPWNLLISAYVRNGQHEAAITTFQHMLSRGIRPDKFTYPSVLKACGELLNLSYGQVVHRFIKGSSPEHNLFVQNALMSMYSKCGEVDGATKIFEKMPEKDSVSWNTIISAYASNGRWKEAFEYFEDMRKDGEEINIITWNTISGGCLKTGNFNTALELISQMVMNGVPLDHVALVNGLGACSHLGELKCGRQFHGLAVRKHYACLDNVRNAIITMYARSKDLKHARELFERVEVKSIITWNSIISGYAHWDLSDDASYFFKEMLKSGVEPNYVTIASILPLCARVANLNHGKQFHAYITKREGFKDHLLLWNALVDTYARSGEVSTAERLFQLLEKKDVVTYTSLIAGYGIQGYGKEAVQLFYEMIRSNIKPDHVAIVSVLSACSHSGLVAEGQILFKQMVSVYGIVPQLEHYACMVDLFGRAGLFKKAEAITRQMPYSPTPAMWATLIAACQKHKNIALGEWAAEKLMQMRPQNSGYYVLIANMYAATGSWSKLAQVRTLMRDVGVRKAPGCAWVDVGGRFFPFLVDDSSNLQIDEDHFLLAGMMDHLRDAGYVSFSESSSEEDCLAA